MRSTALQAFLLASALLLPQAAFAEKISIAVGGIEKQIHLPELLAERLGFLKDEGLDVEFVNVGDGGVSAENELVAGAVQAVSGSYDHTIDLQSKGKFITTIVQFVRVPAEVELVGTKSESIKDPSGLKGQTLGVTGLGGMTDFLTQALVRKSGLQKGDYSVLGVGAGNAFIAAIEQGRVAAGMTTEPTVSYLTAKGSARILVDLRTPEGVQEALGGPYPGDSLYVSATWLAAHPADAQKLANAFVKTLRWIDSHSAQEIAEKLPSSVMAPDRDAYIRILAHDKGIFSPDGSMPNGAPENVLKILSGTLASMRDAKIDLSKTYDMRFVQAASH